MPWTSYVDAVAPGVFAFRVYLTESTGAVLGANFMNNHDVIFDAEKTRVGFAPSKCVYEDVVREGAFASEPNRAHRAQQH